MAEKTSDVFLKNSVRLKTQIYLSLNLKNGQRQEKSWVKISLSPTGRSMLNTGAYPKEECVSTLSQILMADVPQKILFESEGGTGYSAESFRAWQETAQSFGNCSEETGSGLMFENHSQDTRYTGPLNVAQTVSATYGTGGNNQPFVVESSVVPATLKIRCGHGNGGRGALIQKNKSATLSCNNDQTLFVPKAYGICGKYSNSMLSNNPNSGFYEADTSRTIDTSNQSPCKNQGGMVVVEGNGSRPSHHGDGYKESETMYTLNCTENHAVSYGIGRPAMNQGYNARFSFQVEEEKSPTIVASGGRRNRSSEILHKQKFPPYCC